MASSSILKVGSLLGAGVLAAGVAGCADEPEAEPDDQAAEEQTTITVGASPGPYTELFREGIEPILNDQGFEVDYEDFSELRQANVALDEGSVDLNVDQHLAYMQVFNDETNSDLVALTPIPTVPAGLYSEVHDGLDDVEDGHTVLVPNDASNTYRALKILDKAGWIDLAEDAAPAGLSEDDILDNPYDLDIRPVDSATIPRSMADVDWGVIPGSISYSSGVDTENLYLQEDLEEQLILQAVTTEEHEDSEWAKAVTDAYNSDEFLDFVEENNEDNYWYIPQRDETGSGSNDDDDAEEPEGDDAEAGNDEEATENEDGEAEPAEEANA
ncbi:MetQ/NlpA family ABC transporter substrate-binding protein [Corynebacterium otitidis]|uniref:MetQ/NlpA family ABC transporter substrate-binding protein n=1 Tax=Corynebacterium otitidis TaxID=29321 RepID=UPI000627D4D2|nr:MetQ/NlpA family ABC transporter substrate-binding protein [Corynebacterium otitidis]KKO84175.1 metal ABC transporter substrate-binding protein [Corynebacterium otitidis]